MKKAITKYKLSNSSVDEEYLENLWMGIGDVRKIPIINPMMNSDWEDSSKITELIVDTALNPEYLHFFTKYILNIDILPFQAALLKLLWEKPLPIVLGSRGSSKSFTLSIYLIARAVLHQGCKIAVVGAALRQSMVLFNYIEQIWNNAPILRDICGGQKFRPKKGMFLAEWTVGNSQVYFLPLGNGEKIRGQRANIVLADEFASQNEAIFETVVRGFAATKSGGVFNSVVHAAKEKAMKELGLKLPDKEKNTLKLRNQLASNQLILSGTPSYQFNHFYKYFKLYRDIILSGGDKSVLSKEFPELSEAFDDINVEDYAIFRLPYDRVPEGMMDKTMISQGRITMDPTIFNMEYGCVFPGDSDGFFLASYLHNATCPVEIGGTKIDFSVARNGRGDRRYVMGIDPAAEDDNFAICILEINENYRGVVYIWTINRKDFEKLRNNHLIDESIKDYHTFCIKHIRDLLRRFNVELICLDASGGGIHVKEGLKDPDKMLPGEEAILDMDEESNSGDKGRRILKMIQFSDAKWRKDAHYGLRKDILDKVLLFPSGDESDFAISREVKEDVDFDTIEDTYYEVLQCINETVMIQHNQTANGTETWDVPRITTHDDNKNRKRLKRDRFTSLLLSNWAARLIGEVKNYSVSSSVYTAVQRGKRNKSPSDVSTPVNIIQAGSRKIFF